MTIETMTVTRFLRYFLTSFPEISMFAIIVIEFKSKLIFFFFNIRTLAKLFFGKFVVVRIDVFVPHGLNLLISLVSDNTVLIR